MTDPVLYEVRGDVAVLTLNRADAANTLDLAMGRALLSAALRCEAEGVRAVVLTGAGKAFCFGGDLRGMVSGSMPVEPYLKELTTHLHASIARFMRMDAPVVAAVNGTVAGAGVGLLAMADLAILASGAKVSLAYTGVGLTPDGGTSFLLPRAIGAKRAMELILTNRALSAAEALEWGLVNQVVADADVLGEALKLAGRLAAGPKGAFGKSKRLLAASLGALEAQMSLESEAIAGQAATAEGREGINAFLEKRKAQYPR